MITMSNYLTEHQITVHVVKYLGQVEDADGWEHNAYRLQLRRAPQPVGTRTVPGQVSPEFDWRQGLGVLDEPDDRPDHVVDALVSDAMCFANARDFEEFANDMGYDSDSRKAEAIYRACGQTHNWLAKFLGGKQLDWVADNVERL